MQDSTVYSTPILVINPERIKFGDVILTTPAGFAFAYALRPPALRVEVRQGCLLGLLLSLRHLRTILLSVLLDLGRVAKVVASVLGVIRCGHVLSL